MDATRRSQVSAISVPPARAGPSMAAISGFVLERRTIPPKPPLVVDNSRKRPSEIALRSAPAENTGPVWVRMPSHSESSSSIRSMASSSPLAMAPLTAVARLGAVHGYEGDLAVGIEVDHWASSLALDAGGGGGGRRPSGRADFGWMPKRPAICGTRSASLRMAASRSSLGLVGMPAGITCVRTGERAIESTTVAQRCLVGSGVEVGGGHAGQALGHVGRQRRAGLGRPGS